MQKNIPSSKDMQSSREGNYVIPRLDRGIQKKINSAVKPRNDEISKIPVICLMGPTAAGKTQLAIQLTQKLPCDIISVDSGMVYRGMDIGTAKPSSAELAIAPHRLIDIRDPSETYSVAQFCDDALNEIEDIIAHERIPLLVGGTMLYFRALQQGLSKMPSADSSVRAQIALEAEKLGWQDLHAKLAKIDPASAMRISPKDAQRIQRALEVYELTGLTLTQLCEQNKPQPLSYKIINLGLMPASKIALDEKISLRFQQMLKLGFIEEVEQLFNRGDLTSDLPSMRAVGYRQVWQYLSGQLSREAMVEQAIIATRQLAKRQLTWLRSWSNLEVIDSDFYKANFIKSLNGL
jgi:tRNA dimethylallyltransferase